MIGRMIAPSAPMMSPYRPKFRKLRFQMIADRMRRSSRIFKKYSQMKLQMKREALGKLNRNANESGKGDRGRPN
jgi:hypothetical protein